MELRHYVSVLRRWSWLIVLGTVLAAGSSYLVSLNMPKLYEASTTLLVNQAQTPGIVAYNDVLTSQQLVKTYSELIHKRPVLQNALSDLRLPYTPERLDRMLTVRAIRDTMLLELKAESIDPQQAAGVANAVAQAFIEEVRRTQMGQAAQSRDALQEELQAVQRDIRSTSDQMDRLRNDHGGRTPEALQTEVGRLQSALSQYQLTYSQLLKSEQDMRLAEAKAFGSVTVAEPAAPNAIPVKPKVAQNVLLAALVGLMLAVGVALLIEYLDDTVKSGEDVVALLGVPALGYVMRLKGREAEALATLAEEDSRSPLAEAFRVLRTNLQFSLLDRPGRALLVTSSGPREGKTTTAANLAQVMARAGQKVILVDADLRRPSLHRYFGMRNDEGLTTAMLEPGFLGAASARPTRVENLTVLTSGPLPPNPSELLSSQRMASLVESLKGLADVVLFDSPPALAVSDPSVLARLVEGVMVVVDTGKTRADALRETRQVLERAAGPGKLLGAVLNKLGPHSGSYSYYYNFYHQDYGYEGNGNGNGNGQNGHRKRRSSSKLPATSDQ